MINYIVRLLLVALAVYEIPHLLSDIYVSSITTAIIVALVMSLLDSFVKPVLTILSLPITILTLGLFYLVVNVLIVYLCDALVGGFSVIGFWHPLIFSFILSIVNNFVDSFQKQK